MKLLAFSPRLTSCDLKPPISDIVTFVRVSADMLKEDLPYNEVLMLLVNDTNNPALKESVKEIYNDLRQGKDSEEAFIKQEKVLGRFTARMLGLASKSGNMVDIYENTAKFLERNMAFKKSLRSALVSPIFTVLVLIAAMMFYIAYIFPETANLFVKMGMELPPMTEATMQVSDFLGNNIYLLMLGMTLPIIGLGIFFSTTQGRFFWTNT